MSAAFARRGGPPQRQGKAKRDKQGEAEQDESVAEGEHVRLLAYTRSQCDSRFVLRQIVVGVLHSKARTQPIAECALVGHNEPH